MTMVPMAMTRLAADSEGKLGEKVAKLPWDTESQMPTPSSPQPQSWREKKACQAGIASAFLTMGLERLRVLANPETQNWATGQTWSQPKMMTNPFSLLVSQSPHLANGVILASQAP